MLNFKNFLFEDCNKTAVAFHGKVRIPTIGHLKVVNKAKKIAEKTKGKLYINLSGADKPLSVQQKKEHAEKLFQHPVDVGDKKKSSIVGFLNHLHQQGHEHLHLLAGSDRAKEYSNILSNYNGKKDKKGNVPFHFKSWKVHTIGSEREDSDVHPTKMNHSQLEKTVSATKLESLAKGNDYAGFKAYHPNIEDSHVKKLYNQIRKAK